LELIPSQATLLTDERQFLDEYVSLRARYNPGVEAA
jgi:hypothetical protein